MGDFRVIGDIGRSLRKVLESDPWEGLSPKPEIVFRPPGTEERENPSMVSILLFNVREMSQLTSSPVPRSADNFRGPPLMLDLSYLVTAYSDDPIRGQDILGKVMQILHGHPVITGPDLQGSLAGTGTDIRLSLHPLSPGELASVRESFSCDSPHPSVCYVATSAVIESASEGSPGRERYSRRGGKGS